MYIKTSIKRMNKINTVLEDFQYISRRLLKKKQKKHTFLRHSGSYMKSRGKKNLVFYFFIF